MDYPLPSAKKSFSLRVKPSGLTIMGSLNAVDKAFRILRNKPMMTAREMRKLYFRGMGIDPVMFARMHWLVGLPSMHNLDIAVMDSFRTASKNETMNGLSKRQIAMIHEMLTREPKSRLYNGRPTKVIEPDQAALIFHLTRLDASFDAIEEMFTHKIGEHVMGYARVLVRHSYWADYSPWSWDWPEKKPLKMMPL